MLRIDAPTQTVSQTASQVGFKAAAPKSLNKAGESSEKNIKSVKVRDTFRKNMKPDEIEAEKFKASIDKVLTVLKEMSQKHPKLFDKIMSK